MNANKNGFLTFLCACVPGAGQMYYGYMRRGLSILAVFALNMALTSAIGSMAVCLPVIWMYSFFDTYDLIRRISHGCPKEDNFLLGDSLFQNARSHNRLLGWLMVALGIWAAYSTLIQPLLATLLLAFGLDAGTILDRIPGIVVAVLLILGGVWLLGRRSFAQGRNAGTDGADPDSMPYPGSKQ
jgi:hypothetical protein